MSRDVSVVLGAVLLCCLLVGVPAEGFDIYLEGYQGPYRGRVVDAETKEPIAGAAVVAVWMRDKVYPLHSTSVFHGAHEVLTAQDGTFVIDGKDLEQNAPTRTLKPYFRVFSPGFASYGDRAFVARGFQDGLFFDRAGTTIGLPRLRTDREWLESIARARPSAVPDEAIRNLIRLTRAAAESLRASRSRTPWER